MVTREGFYGTWIGSVIQRWIGQVAEINRKYATPKIRMSRSVRLALLCLRLYLIFLVLLLGYKFWTLIR
jgi:hypothetical protein